MSAQEEKRLQRENAPASIQMPGSQQVNGWHQEDGGTTPKPPTPGGLGIGLATPGGTVKTAEESTTLGRTKSVTSQPRQSADRSSDYFSSSRGAKNDAEINAKSPVTPGAETGGVDEAPERGRQNTHD